ncbi:MAG: M6 family metalloprotease domain-containing protein [Bacteroidales bacterium]|nr:M6 family metalloprotease domain-containing protein [Bacteroidales bacterium]NLB86994.1 M6 family metalloprotease domain-containing protein [Bacteroidales bacterium]
MKTNILFTALLLVSVFIKAAPVYFMPQTIFQPNGDKIECFVSGDEFFNFYHDADGYTIIQGDDGWFYYAEKEKDIILPSQYLVNSVNPEQIGLQKWVKISKKEYNKRKDLMFAEVNSLKSGPAKSPHSGDLNNICIYIRFADDTEFTTNRQSYDNKFNSLTSESLKSYYKEVSYDMLNINTSHYPECNMNTNLSYQDSHNRKYFQPYNAWSNPIGYQTYEERVDREHVLLRDAVIWVNQNSPIPTSLNIDADNDGYVDNVCFVIRGNNDGWNDLIWAHRWMLYSYNVKINGKRVWDFTFQPESQVDVFTLAHEMFHSLCAPDLYRYEEDNISPVWYWDIMEHGKGHMLTYMKWKYSNGTWINSIPMITTSGTYTLNPISSSTNNCYKIPSPYSTSEYFVVEYRRKTGMYEKYIPGSGLIVTRINTNAEGNADGPPDEVYVYRPNGNLYNNGNPDNAYFSSGSLRTAINDNTNPSSFLSDGSQGGLDIYNVTAAGNTISFSIGIEGIYTINLSSNPENIGTLIGDGSYPENTELTVRAIGGSGYYFVNWTENGNVVSEDAYYTFTVNENRDLIANFECNLPNNIAVSGGGTFCDSALIKATGGLGSTVYWQNTNPNGTSTDEITKEKYVYQSGNYYFRAKNNCDWGIADSAVVIINHTPEKPIIIKEDNNILVSNYEQGNQWYNLYGEIENEINQTYHAFDNGEYYVVVSEEECSSEPSNTIVIDNLNFGEHNFSNNLKIYPNPVSKELFIENENNIEIELEIINSLGQSEIKSKFYNSLIIPTGDLKAGIYIVKLKTEDNIEFRKILKK